MKRLMSIRITNGKNILFYFIQVLPLILEHGLLCMHFADFADSIAAGDLIQTNTLSFCIFIIFLLFPERSLKVEGCFI
jgi:hypothetical protein